MLFVFRRIRQVLLAEGKLGKYFWYALGETLLVVIGILLALQVNNWNEERVAREKEIVLLENLLEDFITRQNELNEFQDLRVNILNSIEQITGFIANPASRPDDAEMKKILVWQMNLVLFNEQFKVLDVLFNTGEINSISNLKLKKLLLNWPQLVEEMMEEQRLRYELYSKDFLPVLGDHISIRSLLENWEMRNYIYSRNWGAKLESDFEGLLADKRFENYLAFVEFLHRVNNHDTKNLLKSSAEIIELLEAEIK